MSIRTYVVGMHKDIQYDSLPACRGLLRININETLQAGSLRYSSRIGVMIRNRYNRSAEVIARPGPSPEELGCLEKCLESLEPAQRQMLQQYYGAPKAGRAEQAKALGLSLNQLRIRWCRRFLEDDGWFLARTRGSHRQFKHRTKLGTVTVSGKPGIDVPPGTLNSILKQAGLK